MDKMKEQNEEGCRIDGHIRVNKVNSFYPFSFPIFP